jgi:hypothetical protein
MPNGSVRATMRGRQASRFLLTSPGRKLEPGVRVRIYGLESDAVRQYGENVREESGLEEGEDHAVCQI